MQDHNYTGMIQFDLISIPHSSQEATLSDCSEFIKSFSSKNIKPCQM